jgi:hypothetical protein
MRSRGSGVTSSATNIAPMKVRLGSLLLPLFALVWLGMIYASMAGHQYAISAEVRLTGPGAGTVLAADPSLLSLGITPGSQIDENLLPFAEQMRAGAAGKDEIVRIPIVSGTGVRMVSAPALREVREEPLIDKLLTCMCASFSLLLLAYLGYRKPSVMVAVLIAVVGGGALSWPHFLVLLSSWPDVPFAVAGFILRTLCDAFPVLLLASFAIRLGDAGGVRRRIAIWVVDALVVAGFALDGLAEGTPH